MLCRVSRTVRQSFCPTLAADCLPKIQRLAEAKEVRKTYQKMIFKKGTRSSRSHASRGF